MNVFYRTACIALVACGIVSAQTISGVVINPADPTTLDSVSVTVSGMKSSGRMYVDYTVLNQVGFQLTLSLYFAEGVGIPEPAPYSHEEPLGMLDEGYYDLTVKTYEPAMIPRLADQAFTGFYVAFEEPPPMLMSAHSRKTHGPAGIWDIDVGSGDIECRSAQLGTPDPNQLTIVAAFDIPIAVLGGPAAVQADVGTVSAVTQTGLHEVTIEMTGLPFFGQLNLTFPGVVDGWFLASASDSTLCVRVVVGDYDNNGRVNFIDCAGVKGSGCLNQLVSSLDCARADIDCNGYPNWIDFTKVRNTELFNKTAPECTTPIGP